VIFQWDENEPLNPHGLLIAYAEALVKPVVSDFDTFTVGSKGMEYTELAKEQQSMARWCFEKAKHIILTPEDGGDWTCRWLEVLKESRESKTMPSYAASDYGFGDATSIKMIAAAVKATASTGAVRHGAECFNFCFPQELDDEYMIVYDRLPNKPWKYTDEAGLREFLMERALEGYTFPLNPVWPIRDPGWFAILEALQNDSVSSVALSTWYPPESNILSDISEFYKEHPGCFRKNQSAAVSDLDHQEAADKMFLEVERGMVRLRSTILRKVMSRKFTSDLSPKQSSKIQSPRDSQSQQSISPKTSCISQKALPVASEDSALSRISGAS